MNSAGAPIAQRATGQRLAQALEHRGPEEVFPHYRRWLRPAVVLRLAELAREQLRSNTRLGLRLAETSLAIARQIGEDKPLAFALRANANARWFLNENQTALELYGQAVVIFEKLGDYIEVGRTLSSSIQPLIRLGEYARALEGAGRARRIFEEAGDELRLVRLELNVANILHRQDHFQEAFEVYESAYRRLLVLKDVEGIAVALHNIAVCLIALNDVHKALEVYGNVREFCQAHHMPAVAAQAEYNIAYLYYLRGDYSRALEMLVAARVAAEASGDAYHRALCYMDQSEVYLELDMRQEAAESAQEAFTGFQALGVGYESGKALANLAIAQGRMGNLARALDLFSRAREVFQREGNVVWPSLLDLYQALVLHNSGRYAEARKLATNSMGLFRSRKMTGKEVLCGLLLARIALGTNTAEAREHCTAALSLLEGLEAPHLRHQAWVLLGQVEEHERRFADARACYETALAEAESLRSVLRGDELKIAFMSGTREIYQGLVRLCLNLELGPISPEAAFAYVEQAKSRSLRELVSEGAVSHRRVSRDSALGGQAVALKEELNWYYHRIELEQAGEQLHSVERLAELEQQARQCERKLAALLRELPPQEAGTAEFGATGTQPLDTIRRVLEPDTVLVEYFRVDERMVAAVVSATSLDFVRLGPSSRVEELTQSLHFQFSKFQLGSDYMAACHRALLETTRGHLRNLYRELIEPLQDRLRSRRLVFVPHESLHHLPLHALFDGQQHLLDRFAISYAPSASVYALCSNRRASADGPSLVLGVPDPRAPMILSEVNSVAAALPGSELMVGDSATRQVLETKGSRCRFLHIATHGRFREDRPMFSAIRLGDGYLTLYDLDQLSLPVDLATLSGCSTGRSVVAGGDELLGLVRGFLQAGARTLLLTLWDVHDRSTALLMSSFYRRLATGYEKAEALRGAMRELRDTHPHPYFWAPFVLIGKA